MPTSKEDQPFINPLAHVPQMVVGFAYDFMNNAVLLIEKKRPSWMAGKLNGIGGKVEPGETPIAAMCREYYEETGILTTESDWSLFHYEKRRDGPELFFYCARLDGIVALAEAKTDEHLVSVDLKDWHLQRRLEGSRIKRHEKIHMLYNLAFLIPMGLCWIQNTNHRYDL